MSLIKRLIGGLKALFHKEETERELDEELRGYLETAAAEKMKVGMSREEAMRQVRMSMGSPEGVKESVRSNGWETFAETLWQDIRFAVRILAKTPVITAVALLSLALGIGANTAIFSLIDAVMLRMLPVQHPEQLVEILFRSPTTSRLRPNVTNPIWEQVRDHQDAFASVFAWSSTDFDLANGGQESTIPGIYASGGYFTTLGVRPAAGRLLAALDDVRGCSGVAVLGYGFWQSHYAGAESAIGSFIRLNGYSFPIVGVAQRGFSGIDIGTSLDVAIPICAEAILDGKNSSLDVRDDWWLGMMGRLNPGMSVEQAGARMRALSQPLFGAVVPQDWPPQYQDVFRKYTYAVLPAATGAGGPFGLRNQYSRPLEILMFVVGLVLLIACANIASLLLARAAARQREIGVRLSLGASRARLVRQVLTESIVLSGAGAILGVLFARWGSAFLVRFVSGAHNQIFLDLGVDGRVLAFTVGIAILTGLLFGILPAFRATRVSLTSAMKGENAESSEGRLRFRSERWIVAAQVALSLVLLIGTGLFIRTFTNLMTLDAGFDRNNVLMVETNIHNAGIAEPARAPLYGQMLAKLQAIPGVVSASQCWMTPLSGRQWDNSLAIPGGSLPAGADPDIFLNWVTPDFFATMRMPLVQGRVFDERDTVTSASVVIVNHLLARTYFPGQNPIGKHLLANSKGMLSTQPMEIIGVTQDAKYSSLREDFPPEAYFPLAQIGAVGEGTTFEIRTATNPTSLIPAVRDALGRVNKLASLQFLTLRQEADDSVIQERLLAVLSGFFGGLALLLTAIGLYGVMSYVVTRRQREIGIRMALGAQQGRIVRLILRDVSTLLAAGIAVGLLGAWWATRFVQQFLFNLKPRDTATIVLAVAVLVAVALIAGFLPARRASHLDPMRVLREE
ncbi:MAG TPA: ABC transporter permease [Candidatus Acidoferrales bacterium]|nr:ABC transporter permease [Candidatus Acidoferrales bacterium]